MEFGQGIETSKIEFKRKNTPCSEFRSVKIALLGERQIHGDDDVFAMRPYSATLRCSKANSELYVFKRAEFYRLFKLSHESWNFAF